MKGRNFPEARKARNKYPTNKTFLQQREEMEMVGLPEFALPDRPQLHHYDIFSSVRDTRWVDNGPNSSFSLCFEGKQDNTGK